MIEVCPIDFDEAEYMEDDSSFVEVCPTAFGEDKPIGDDSSHVEVCRIDFGGDGPVDDESSFVEVRPINFDGYESCSFKVYLMNIDDVRTLDGVEVVIFKLFTWFILRVTATVDCVCEDKVS